MDKNDIFELTEHWNLHKEDLKEKKYYLFNVKDGDIVKLNEESYEILGLIDGKRTLQAIHNAIYATFSADAEVLWRDLYDLIDKCVKENVIRIH